MLFFCYLLKNLHWIKNTHAHIYAFLFNFSLFFLSSPFFRFEFPKNINLGKFCAPGVDQEHDYKLYSVVVHRGGAGRGHYFPYILDVYGEGKWVEPHPDDLNFKLGYDRLGYFLTEMIALEITNPQDLVHAAKSNFPEITLVGCSFTLYAFTCIFFLFLM